MMNKAGDVPAGAWFKSMPGLEKSDAISCLLP